MGSQVSHSVTKLTDMGSQVSHSATTTNTSQTATTITLSTATITVKLQEIFRNTTANKDDKDIDCTYHTVTVMYSQN